MWWEPPRPLLGTRRPPRSPGSPAPRIGLCPGCVADIRPPTASRRPARDGVTPPQSPGPELWRSAGTVSSIFSLLLISSDRIKVRPAGSGHALRHHRISSVGPSCRSRSGSAQRSPAARCSACPRPRGGASWADDCAVSPFGEVSTHCGSAPSRKLWNLRVLPPCLTILRAPGIQLLPALVAHAVLVVLPARSTGPSPATSVSGWDDWDGPVPALASSSPRAWPVRLYLRWLSGVSPGRPLSGGARAVPCLLEAVWLGLATGPVLGLLAAPAGAWSPSALECSKPLPLGLSEFGAIVSLSPLFEVSL